MADADARLSPCNCTEWAHSPGLCPDLRVCLFTQQQLKLRALSRLPARRFRFLDGTLTVTQEASTEFISADGTAGRLWGGSILLLEVLHCFAEHFRGKVVIELGAGTGLVSAAAALCGAAKVLACDKDTSALHAESNARSLGSCVDVLQHTWGRDDEDVAIEKRGGLPADFVLCSDVLYFSEQHEALCSTLTYIAHRSPHMLLILAYPERNAETEASFFRRLRGTFEVKLADMTQWTAWMRETRPQALDAHNPELRLMLCRPMAKVGQSSSWAEFMAPPTPTRTVAEAMEEKQNPIQEKEKGKKKEKEEENKEEEDREQEQKKQGKEVQETAAAVVVNAAEPSGRYASRADVTAVGSALPSCVLVVRRGFGGRAGPRFARLCALLEPRGVKLHMPDSYAAQPDVCLYRSLLHSLRPDMVVACSSGGTIVSALATGGDDGQPSWCGPTWVISARQCQALPDVQPDLPVLFSHGTTDNHAFVRAELVGRMRRAELHVFSGSHSALELFDLPDAQLLALVARCLALGTVSVSGSPYVAPRSTLGSLLAGIRANKRVSN